MVQALSHPFNPQTQLPLHCFSSIATHPVRLTPFEVNHHEIAVQTDVDPPWRRESLAQP
jgi:hypothetical protein